MRKIAFIFCIATTLLLCLQSCENNENLDAEKEYVEVGLKPRGIDISMEPMENRASSNDMYCVYVEHSNGISYATWVTDDLTSDKIKLLKGYKYRMYVMYIPNGQNILKGVGYAPFDGIHQICPDLNDGICYGGKYGNHSGLIGAARKKEDKASGMVSNGYYLNDVDRYHGYVEVEATASVTLDVNLYRQMYGLEINATNFTEGTIRIDSGLNGQTGNNEIILTPSTPSVYKVLEMEIMPWSGSGVESEDDVKNYKGTTNFFIEYIGTDGKSITILNYAEPIKRMTKVKINLDIKEILEDIFAGLNPNVISDEQWEEVIYEY